LRWSWCSTASRRARSRLLTCETSTLLQPFAPHRLHRRQAHCAPPLIPAPHPRARARLPQAKRRLLANATEAGLCVNGVSKVISADINGGKSVIHIVDRVVVPPSMYGAFNETAIEEAPTNETLIEQPTEPETPAETPVEVVPAPEPTPEPAPSSQQQCCALRAWSVTCVCRCNDLTLCMLCCDV
jgi:hypothetical protein